MTYNVKVYCSYKSLFMTVCAVLAVRFRMVSLALKGPFNFSHNHIKMDPLHELNFNTNFFLRASHPFHMVVSLGGKMTNYTDQ